MPRGQRPANPRPLRRGGRRSPDDYDRWYRTPRGGWIGAVERALVASMAGQAPGESALDVGCGTGYFTEPLVGAGSRVVGVDCDIAMLRYTRKRGGARVDWVAAEAEHLPFGDRSFDVAISVTALCFVFDERAAIEGWFGSRASGVVVGFLNAASVLGCSPKRGKGDDSLRNPLAHGRPCSETSRRSAGDPSDRAYRRVRSFRRADRSAIGTAGVAHAPPIGALILIAVDRLPSSC